MYNSSSTREKDEGVVLKLLRPEEEMERIIVTDVGSTTTKARLLQKVNGEGRYA